MFSLLKRHSRTVPRISLHRESMTPATNAANWRAVKIAYDVVEPSAGTKNESPPIILLHGMTSAKESWKRISGSLANGSGLKVFSLDSRNHGDSEWSDLFDYTTMAMDLSHFMEQNNIPKAILVGHSMGGKLAMSLAAEEPEKVVKLIVEDRSPNILNPVKRRFPCQYLQLMKKSMEIIQTAPDEKTAKIVLKEFFKKNMPKEELGEKLQGSVFTPPFRKTDKGYQWKANIEVIEREFYGRVNPRNTLKGRYMGESLFIYGTKSTYDVMEDKDLILEMFPRAKFHAVEGATHLVHLEYPEEFTEAVLEFLKES